MKKFTGRAIDILWGKISLFVYIKTFEENHSEITMKWHAREDHWTRW